VPDAKTKRPTLKALCVAGLLVASCFREAYPCDEQTALALVAKCAAAYKECELAGHADDCPATAECDRLALERQERCEDQILRSE